MNSNILISIITINYNNGEGLEKTAASVCSQDFHNFEWIVIDGGSTDSSQQVMQNYRFHIDYMVSESDKGIYNAMNKGIKQAKGAFCLFLNSGDYLLDKHILSNISCYLLKTDADIIVGNIIKEDSMGCRTEKITPKEIDSFSLIKSAIPHPASFIRTTVMNEHNYRENYKIVSDWLFFIEMFVKYGKKFQVVDCFVSVFNTEGISHSNDVLCGIERENGLKEVLGNRIYEDYHRLIFGKTEIEKNVRYLECNLYFYKVLLEISKFLVNLHVFLCSLHSKLLK